MANAVQLQTEDARQSTVLENRLVNDLPLQVAGTVRTNQDPGWTIVDRATNAFGQGIAVTPVQLLQAVAVFANDGQLVRPRLVRGDAPLRPEWDDIHTSRRGARRMVTSHRGADMGRGVGDGRRDGSYRRRCQPFAHRAPLH